MLEVSAPNWDIHHTMSFSIGHCDTDLYWAAEVCEPGLSSPPSGSAVTSDFRVEGIHMRKIGKPFRKVNFGLVINANRLGNNFNSVTRWVIGAVLFRLVCYSIISKVLSCLYETGISSFRGNFDGLPLLYMRVLNTIRECFPVHVTDLTNSSFSSLAMKYSIGPRSQAILSHCWYTLLTLYPDLHWTTVSTPTANIFVACYLRDLVLSGMGTTS